MKSFNRILEDMVTWMLTSGSKLTNFHSGSVIRTLYESIAAEIEALYYEARKGFKNAVENSIFHSFDFYRTDALPATGELTLQLRSDSVQSFIIPKGTRFFTIPLDGRKVVYFKTTEELEVLAGVSAVKIMVECEEKGVIGNVPPFSIRRSVNSLSLVEDIYNESKFFNGAPRESKESRKQRFSNFITTLARGTVPAIEYGVNKVQGVSGVRVVESIGILRVYAHNAEGNLPENLKKDIEESLIDYKTAGIKALVLPVNKSAIDVNIEVLLNSGYPEEKYEEAIQSSVESYLQRFTVSQDLYKSDMIRFIMGIDTNAIINVEVEIEGELITGSNTLIRPGQINVSVSR